MEWVIIGLVVLAIAGFALVGSDNSRKNLVASKLAELPDFKAERTLIKTSINHGQRGLSIDSQSKKAYLIVQDSLIAVRFTDILESEVIVDGSTVTKTSRASQVVGAVAGGVLLGGVGAIIGGLSGKTTATQEIKNVVLRLVVNNMEHPVHDIGFIELGYAGGTPGASALQDAQMWHSILKVVVFQGQSA